MNFAILGAGGIAHTMASTVVPMKEICKKAVAARDYDRAESFAKEYGFEKAYGSYEEMLADPEIDLVYIAVPHSHHCQWTKAALEAGKNVLCEKSFAVNEKQAKEMIDLARSKNLLLTEAIWTRYMPSRQMILDIIDSGVIGEVTSVSANLGYQIDAKERIVRPELAGGALLDLTVYPLNFASMVLGDDIAKIDASCVKTETGVDGMDTVMLTYKDGKMATMFTTIYSLTDRSGYIYGRNGYIEVQNINNPEVIRVWDANRSCRNVIAEYKVPEQITGYEYEVLACKKALEEGRIECPEMPHAETLKMMNWMDQIRAQFGIVFPGIE
ncbi:MAG: Gfo/Idh/MocA family protein [Muricoprocola sp.]